MKLAILAAALLAGCATPALPHDHGSPDHGPTIEQVVATTSLRREALKSVEVGYGAAMVAAENAFDGKQLTPQELSVLPALKDRADGALDLVRAKQAADDVQFIAALFYANYANNELLKLAEGNYSD